MIFFTAGGDSPGGRRDNSGQRSASRRSPKQVDPSKKVLPKAGVRVRPLRRRPRGIAFIPEKMQAGLPSGCSLVLGCEPAYRPRRDYVAPPGSARREGQNQPLLCIRQRRAGPSPCPARSHSVSHVVRPRVRVFVHPIVAHPSSPGSRSAGGLPPRSGSV